MILLNPSAQIGRQPQRSVVVNGDEVNWPIVQVGTTTLATIIVKGNAAGSSPNLGSAP